MIDLFKSYKEIALKALSYHDYTPKGLYKKILAKAVPPVDHEIAKKVIAYLHTEGLISEKRYGEVVLESCDRSLYGPAKIRKELIRRDFSDNFIEKAQNREINFESRAYKLLLSHPDFEKLNSDQKVRDKLYNYLVRQGYSFSTAKNALYKANIESEYN